MVPAGVGIGGNISLTNLGSMIRGEKFSGDILLLRAENSCIIIKYRFCRARDGRGDRYRS